jgi:N-methylhydantoinase A
MKEQDISEERIMFQRYADMRYLGQEHTVKVPIPGKQIEARHISEINEKFRQLHEQAYTFRLESPVELVNYHLIAFGTVDKPELVKLKVNDLSIDAAEKGERRVNFDELGFHVCPIYERDLLPIGRMINGPLVIEEPASTTVVFPDQKVTRNDYGFLEIENIIGASE